MSDPRVLGVGVVGDHQMSAVRVALIRSGETPGKSVWTGFVRQNFSAGDVSSRGNITRDDRARAVGSARARATDINTIGFLRQSIAGEEKRIGNIERTLNADHRPVGRYGDLPDQILIDSRRSPEVG